MGADARADARAGRAVARPARGLPLPGGWRGAIILARLTDPAASAFVRRDDLPRVSQQGTGDAGSRHSPKRASAAGRDVVPVAAALHRSFEANAARHPVDLLMLYPAPRVVLDRAALGLLAVGRTRVREAAVVEDVVSTRLSAAERLETWTVLPESDVFDVEHRDPRAGEAPSPPAATGILPEMSRW